MNGTNRCNDLFTSRWQGFWMVGLALSAFVVSIVPPLFASTFIQIDVPGSIGTAATGINDRGDVVGFSIAPEGRGQLNFRTGFLRDNKGTLTTFGVPRFEATVPNGINNRRDIVGIVGYLSSFANGSPFLLSGGVLTTTSPQNLGDPTRVAVTFTDINEHGQIVGTVTESGVRNTFIVDKEGSATLLDLPGLTNIDAEGINDRGDIVGSAVFSDRRSHGFLFSQGTVIPIDVPGASSTGLSGINDRGDMVGNANFPVGEGALQHRAFYIDKHRVITFFEVPGGTITTVGGVNAQGDIVGSYSANGMTHGFLASGVF